MKDPNSTAAINASSTLMAPNETKGSILSVFKQKIKIFASRENLSEMLSYSDIDLKSIGEKPTAVFIVIQDEKKTYHALATILIKQIYETLIATAQKAGGRLPVRTNFLLDEFANMPPLKDVTTMITAARSRAIRLTMIVQNFAQLDQVYGEKEAETIKGNCSNIIYLITSELKALEEISKLCGEVKSKKDDKTASTPLVTISDLQTMKQFDVIIKRLRLQPFKTHFTPDFKLDWGKKYPLATYPTRKKRPVATFDIKEFVKAEKRRQLLAQLQEEGNDDDNRPFTPGGMPFNPFLQQTVRRQPLQPVEDDDDDDISIDTDELARKINAKIAAIEKEAKEKETKEKETKQAKIPEEKPVASKKEVKEIKIEDEDDDDFFDDFFDN